MQRWLGLVVLGAVGCDRDAISAGVIPVFPPEGTVLSRDVTPPNLSGPIVQRHPRLAEVSRFADRRVRTDDGGPGTRGPVGVGNGRVFALVGLGDDPHALHGMTGPTYARGTRGWGDLGLQLRVDGQDWPMDRQVVARVRGTPVAVVDSRGGRYDLMTVDHAPVDRDGEGLPGIVRHIQVRNGGPETEDLTVRIETSEPFEVGGGLVVARREEDGARWAIGGFAGTELAFDGQGRLVVPFEAVEPGEEAEAVLALIPLGADDDGVAALRRLVDEEPDGLLVSTLQHWRDRSAQGLQLHLADPWLLDWIDGLRVALDVQRSHTGAVASLSPDARAGLHGVLGPVRAWHRLGLPDLAEAALVYLAACHRLAGDLQDRCPADLEGADAVPAPVWGALPTLRGPLQAAGSSHLALAWARHVDWTGDQEVLAPHWAYLMRAVVAQATGPDGLQPFAGQEPFLDPLAVALGVPLDTAWAERGWSSHSLLMRAGAARALAAASDGVVPQGDRQILDAIADAARRALTSQMVREDGAVIAVRAREGEPAWPSRTFEDVALTTTWSGAYPPEDPVAQGALAGVLEQGWREEGIVVSPVDGQYQDGPYGSGFATGRSPGLVLHALAAAGHPWRDAVRAEAFRAAGPTGVYPQAYALQGRTALQLVYDPDGVAPDDVARFQPDAAGVVLDALLEDLLGVAPLGPPEAARIALSPRVPSGLDEMVVGPIRVRGVSIAVRVFWADGWIAEVTHEDGPPLALHLSLPLHTTDPVSLVLESAGGGGTLVRAPGGEVSAVFAVETLDPGQTRTYVARNVRGVVDLDRKVSVDPG